MGKEEQLSKSVTASAVRRDVRARFRAVPLGVWLALASSAVLVVVLIGNRLAQQSTHTASEYVSRVEQQFGPLAQLARELGDAIAAFDRAIFSQSKSDHAGSASAIEAASHALLRTLTQYQGNGLRINGSGGDLSAEVISLHREGLAVAD